MNKIHPEQQHQREARRSCEGNKQCLVHLGPLGPIDVMVVAEGGVQEGC